MKLINLIQFIIMIKVSISTTLLNQDNDNNINCEIQNYCSSCMVNYYENKKCYWNDEKCLNISNNKNLLSNIIKQELSEKDNLLKIIEKKCQSNNENSVIFNNSINRDICGNTKTSLIEPSIIIFNSRIQSKTQFIYKEFNIVQATKSIKNQYCFWDIFVDNIRSTNQVYFEVINQNTNHKPNINFKLTAFIVYSKESIRTNEIIDIEGDFTILLSNVLLIRVSYISDDSLNSDEFRISIFKYARISTYKNLISDIDNYGIDYLRKSLEDENSKNETDNESNINIEIKNENKTDLMAIIFPIISSVFILTCLAIFITIYIRRLKARNALENANNQAMEISRLRNHENIDSIINENPNAILFRERNSDKNKRILNDLFNNGELKEIKYNDSHNEYNSDCSICLDSFIKDDNIVILFCKHIFHKNCLKEWLEKNILKPKCPNCNYNVIHKTYENIVEVDDEEGSFNNIISNPNDNQQRNLRRINISFNNSNSSDDDNEIGINHFNIRHIQHSNPTNNRGQRNVNSRININRNRVDNSVLNLIENTYNLNSRENMINRGRSNLNVIDNFVIFDPNTLMHRNNPINSRINMRNVLSNNLNNDRFMDNLTEFFMRRNLRETMNNIQENQNRIQRRRSNNSENI